MAARTLEALICGKPAGKLCQDEAGLISFTYNEDYAGAPLSLSMPVSNRTYPQKVVVPYLFGLLPDSESVRRDIAMEYDISPNNPVAMLEHAGLDCPGGVQFCRPDAIEESLHRSGAYAPISEAQIASRLRQLRERAEESWLGADEHWSLGGNQGKFALAWHNNAWHACLGSAATTHIFKNGVIGFKLQALNEFVCMKLARACNIPTAGVAYQLFEDEPALIVERYDRIARPDGSYSRAHQEDFCQSLGVHPKQKYTSDGGPTTADAVALLASTKEARNNLIWFTQMLFFNCLIGAPDAHAKNYSLLLGEGRDALLAPMYDVASGLAYESLRRKGRLAMAVGGENRFGRVGAGAITRYSELPGMAKADISTELCIAIMRHLAELIPAKLGEVFDTWMGIPGMHELRGHLERPIAENCADTLRAL